MGPIVIAASIGGAALLFAAALAAQVLRADEGNSRMREIGVAIREGSNAFLRREYLTLVPFVIVMAVVLGERGHEQVVAVAIAALPRHECRGPSQD